MLLSEQGDVLLISLLQHLSKYWYILVALSILIVFWLLYQDEYQDFLYKISSYLGISGPSILSKMIYKMNIWKQIKHIKH